MTTRPVTTAIPAMLGIPNTLPPLCRHDLWRLTGFGALGIVLFLLGNFSKFNTPELIVWPWVLTCILLIVWAAIRAIRRMAFQKSNTGRAWPDLQKTVFTAVMISFGFGFFFWGKSIGLSFQTIVAILLMVEGLGGVFVSLTDWWRLSHLGVSSGLIAAGFLLPLHNWDSIGPAVGIAIITGTACSVTILYYQIRYQERKSHKHSI